MFIVFCSPVPISTAVPPGTAINRFAPVDHVRSTVADDGYTSKYLPVVFPAVEGVMNIFPPAGPVSPIE